MPEPLWTVQEIADALETGPTQHPSPQPSPPGRGCPVAAVATASPLPEGEGQGEGLRCSGIEEPPLGPR